MSRMQPPVVKSSQVVTTPETLNAQPSAAERSDWTELRLPEIPTHFTSVGQSAALPASLRGYIERLNSDKFQVRDAATREIASNPALQADLESVLFSHIAGELPLEVSFRLNSALQLLWNNKPELQRLKEIEAIRTTENFEELLEPVSEILSAIQAGDNERYMAGIQQLERFSALSEAYLNARNGVLEQYQGAELAIGQKGSVQTVDIAIRRLDRLLANPSAVEPGMFAEIERLHDLVMERHNLNPQDLHTLDNDRLYSLLGELHSELDNSLPSSILKSAGNGIGQNRVLRNGLIKDLQAADLGVGGVRTPF